MEVQVKLQISLGNPIFIKWNEINVRVFRYGEDYMIPKNGFKG